MANSQTESAEEWGSPTLDSLGDSGKSTFLFGLRSRFRDRADKVTSETDQHLADLHNLIVKGNAELDVPLETDVLKTVEQFYNLKRERQLRGLFELAAIRTLDASIRRMKDILDKLDSGKHIKSDADAGEKVSLDGLPLGNRQVPFLQKTASGSWDVFFPHSVKTGRRLGRIEDSDEPSSEPHNDFVKFTSSQGNLAIIVAAEEVGGEPYLHVNSAGIDTLRTSLLTLLAPSERSKGQKKFMKNQGKDIKAMGERFMGTVIDLVQSSPDLHGELEENFEVYANSRKRYSERKVNELLGMLSVISQYCPEKDKKRILDVCCGTGDVATTLKLNGYQVKGVDVDKEYLRLGNVYNRILTGKKATHLHEANIVEDSLPEAEVWVAKHPCASGLALPDTIIKRFMADQTAEKLLLLTCCANKSADCCPPEYVDAGLTNTDDWSSICKSSQFIEGEDATECKAAIGKINDVRIRYAKQTYPNADIRIEEIPGTVMNQMIVITKKNQR